MWGFSQVVSGGTYKGCYPTFAMDPTTHDQVDFADLAFWPDTSGSTCSSARPCYHKKSCRTPSTDKGNPGDSFPVYYTIQSCNTSNIMVIYNLFYEKDGFLTDVAVEDENGLQNGHP
jgi:hypothetical protein